MLEVKLKLILSVIDHLFVKLAKNATMAASNKNAKITTLQQLETIIDNDKIKKGIIDKFVQWSLDDKNSNDVMKKAIKYAGRDELPFVVGTKILKIYTRITPNYSFKNHKEFIESQGEWIHNTFNIKYKSIDENPLKYLIDMIKELKFLDLIVKYNTISVTYSTYHLGKYIKANSKLDYACFEFDGISISNMTINNVNINPSEITADGVQRILFLIFDYFDVYSHAIKLHYYSALEFDELPQKYLQYKSNQSLARGVKTLFGVGGIFEKYKCFTREGIEDMIANFNPMNEMFSSLTCPKMEYLEPIRNWFEYYSGCKYLMLPIYHELCTSDARTEFYLYHPKTFNRIEMLYSTSGTMSINIKWPTLDLLKTIPHSLKPETIPLSIGF